MQLFLVSPILIFPMFYMRKRMAWTWIGTLMLASIAPGLYYMAKNSNYPPTLLPNSFPLAYFYDIYGNTYVRAGPYLIGIAVGYLLHTQKRGSLKLSKVQVSIKAVGNNELQKGLVSCVIMGLCLIPCFKLVRGDLWLEHCCCNSISSCLRIGGLLSLRGEISIPWRGHCLCSLWQIRLVVGGGLGHHSLPLWIWR